MKNKKGQVEMLIPIVSTILVLGIILVVGLILFQQGRDTFVDQGFVGPTVTVVNETVVYTNNSFSPLANSCEAGLSCVSVHNGSADAELIGTGNYSCTRGRGILLTNVQSLNETNINVSYTCNSGDLGFNASQQMSNATLDIPGWIPIFIIVLVGFFVIGIVELIRRQG